MRLPIPNGLIVSCQALYNEPLHYPGYMTMMAKAVVEGGAQGIRANGIPDVVDIKKHFPDLPLIGLIKRDYAGYEPYITATLKEVEQLAATAVDVIAVDLTNRPRPGFQTPEAFLRQIKSMTDIPIMADISCYEEGVAAYQNGADYISTTLVGYTEYTLGKNEPDYALIEKLAAEVGVPVVAEGHINQPHEARRCLDCGAYAVVVGSAITRPQYITKKFADAVQSVALNVEA